MFIGRKKEKKEIENFLLKNGAMMVYGLRRVGKTTLIKKVLESNKQNFVYFECQNTTEEENVRLFVQILKEQINFVDAKFDSFLAVFKELDKNYQNNIIVIDEYSYLKQYYIESKKSSMHHKAAQIDSEFQNIIDNCLKNTKLILSGSSIHIMQQLNEYKSPLYGRLNPIIKLSQLSYLEAYEMLKDLSYKDFISFYSVFGGSPYVLKQVNAQHTLKQNICSLLLNEDGGLKNHLKYNVINELESDPDLNDVLNAIKNGKKKYSDIESICHITTAGLLDKRLKKLIDLDIIEAIYPIGRENEPKKKLYQIKDNLLKFYYAYIFRQENRINLLGENNFFNLFISKSLDEFISRRFESIVRDYFTLLVKNNLRDDIVDIGSFFMPNNEFDCVLKKNDNTYAVYEAKYRKNPMNVNEINNEVSQIKQIKGLKISEIGFACSSGFKNNPTSYKYITLSNIFKLDQNK